MSTPKNEGAAAPEGSRIRRKTAPDKKALERARAHLLQEPDGQLTSGPSEASRTVSLPLSENSLRAAAILVSTILYPDAEDGTDRMKAERAIAFQAMKLSGNEPSAPSLPTTKPNHDFGEADAQTNLYTADAWQTFRCALPGSEPRILPEHLNQSDKDRNAILKKAKVLWKRRMSGAKMARLLILDHVIRSDSSLTADSASVPPLLRILISQRDWDRISKPDPVGVHEAVDLYGEDGGNRNIFNARSRSFTATFPVLHVAIGLDWLLSLEGRYPSTADHSFERLLGKMTSPEFVAALLGPARICAHLIGITPKLHQVPPRLICFNAT